MKMNFLIFISLIIIGYSTGRYVEKKHIESLKKKEQHYNYMPLITGEWKSQIQANQEGQIFGAGVVIGADYFKSFVAGLRGLLGGRLSTYESLLDRGRREAIVRMQEKAENWGAEKVINVIIETAVIGNLSGKQALPCVELYVYGTAIKNRNHAV